MLYVSEIHSDDDEPETEHEGQPVEQLDLPQGVWSSNR